MSKNNYYELRKNVLRELADGFSCIHDNFKYFKTLNKNKIKIIGAAEWLLDNIYLIEKEYKCIKKCMPLEYFKNLPCGKEYLKYIGSDYEYINNENKNGKREDNIPRILILAKKYINEKRKLEFNELVNFIKVYENDEENKKNIDYAFTMGELWAFPIMLRMGIILNLANYTNELVKIQRDVIRGKQYAEKVLDSINKESIQEEFILSDINSDNNDNNLSPLFLREFIRILRENSIKDKEIYDYSKLKWNLDIDYSKFEIKANMKEQVLEQNIGEYITAIRTIEGINWREFFEETSLVDQILQDDPVDVYGNMDFESKDYYRHKLEEIARIVSLSEIKIAMNTLALANESKSNGEEDYKCHVGYYIIDHGTCKLEGYYHDLTEVISHGKYIAINLLGTFFISFLFLIIGSFLGVSYTLKQFIIAFLLIMIPVNEIIVGVTNYIVSKIVRMRFVPKVDLSSGISEEYKTVVVIPAIVNSVQKVKELMDKLEVYHCGNDDKNIYFALLSDFEDSEDEYRDSDKKIIDSGLECTARLNKKYGNKFFFLSRKRVYNEKMGIYMGKERKRGKLLEFMALLRDKSDNTFDVISSSIDKIKDAKYIITLDEDTFMPRDTAYKLVGAMSHVLNIPYVNKNNVVIRGYNIMQPKVKISMESKNATRFSQIFGGDSGVDGYSTAYSDTYQDLFGEGSFVGKGIINIDQFYDITKKSIGENKILSHDLLEGALTRCALVTDVEFVDGYPAYYEGSCNRLYRWVRGDWQLIGWLFSRKISLLDKWKIFDNLRRSLLAPNLLLSLLISLMVLRGNSQIALLCFLVLIMPLVFTVTDFVVTPKNRLMGAFKTFKQIILIISFIPYESVLMVKAISITLFRVIVSKKNLLEWRASQIADRYYKNDFKSYLKRMWFGPLMGVFLIIISFNNSIEVSIYALIPAVLWICSPYIAYYISKDLKEAKVDLDESEKEYLRKLTRRIYAYYEDFVNEENNYLAPDNYQEKPFKGVAHRTSPTNIGMGLMANITAYDMGYITLKGLIDKTELILTSMNTLEKVHGHYLNWYDTKTKSPLYPRYVSTVDNGNLLANLWILKETMKELKSKPLIRLKEITSLYDIYRIIKDEDSKIKIRFSDDISLNEYLNILEDILIKMNFVDGKFNSEVEYWLNKLFCEVSKKIEYYHNIFDDVQNLYNNDFSEGAPSINELIKKCRSNKERFGENLKCSIQNYLIKIDKIINQIDLISNEMNFNFLYDKNRGLFSIGYNVEENSLGSSYYDLLASECRIASFVAISKNDVPKSHWFKLSRAMTNAFHTHSLVSWSGTMFEYFMPSLIMRNYPKTLMDQTYRSVIKAQIAFAKQKKIPWGISESAFYEFDSDENYQYKAFGIPGLGLKRGLEDEVVVSPYSTIISIPFCGEKAIKNLKDIQGGGTLGRYGFIEAIDYTKARKDKFITLYDVNNHNRNVDNSVNNVDKCGYAVDNVVLDGDKNDELYIVDNVDNVNNFGEKRRNIDISMDSDRKKEQNNPQKHMENYKSFSEEGYPQNYEDIYNDGIKPNKVFTYMVHHLGMSIMALDNVLNDNILINRFHKLPCVKASELLLKEKVPSYVTFERNEDFSIKNRYFKGEVITPRIFKVNDNNNFFDEQQVLLLSNDEYSSMINVCGSGYSKKNDMMLYRWKGSTTSDDSGLFFYIKNLNSNDYWSSTFEPCKTFGKSYETEFKLDKAKFSRRDGNIESITEVSLSTEENFEVRKITLNNIGDKGRSLEVTSYCEITLTTFGADSVHPAFSNLFIQTEYDEKEKILLGSRRGRVKGAKVPYIFQKIIVNGECEGELTYETSRVNFIGRNRDLKNPKAMDNDKTLDNTVGTVLDPILSMRARVRIEGNEKREIYFITGTCDSKDEVIEISKKYNDSSKVEKIFQRYSASVQLELKNLEITSITANLFQELSSHIFYLQSGREDREEYIKNIKKHQKDLWAYGISGDLPIVVLTIEDEEDISLVMNIIKFYSYMKLKGVKIDLVIYNNEEVSYDEPLQKSILQAINSVNEGNSLNKAAGIYVHNKSTMSEEIKDFLIGISRLYIDSKNGTLLEQFKKYNNEKSKINISDDRNIYSRSNVLTEAQNTDISEQKRVEYGINDNKIIEENNDFKRSNNSNNIDTNNKLKSNERLSIKEIDSLNINDGKDNINASEASINTNDDNVNYYEYDHDIDFINKNDLIEGMENHNKNDSHNYDLEKDYSNIELDFFNGYGGFDKEDNTYVIRLSNYKNTPAPWINVMSNADFGFHISESGSSYTWCGNSRENKITPWSNDYIIDPIGEALYIRDDKDGRYFSISPKPVRDKGEYIIKHGFGYSQFMHTACNIKGTMKVFAPKDEKVKLQIITLENSINEEREISIFYYAKLVLGVYGYESERYISTYAVKNNNTIEYIGGNNPYSEYFGNLHAYLTIVGGSDLTVSGDTKEFIGFGGEVEEPKALKFKDLSNKTGSIYDPCLSACTKVKLKPHEKREVVIVFGQNTEENIIKVIEKYKDINNAYDAFKNVKKYWNNFLGNIQVSTPDKSMNYMLNGWLLYQTLSCRYLSRSAFYQSGGAYGFRDQLQDSMALGVVDPEIPKAQIIRSASRQYVEGDVQHWWHPVVNSGIRTRFSDDLLWMPYVTAQYINSTGDYSILNIKSPYLEDEPLREGEDERYTIVNESSQEGTIYEHCQKAIEKSLKFGKHNIPLMGSGDWNDGMSTVGNQGRGESVWLGWFLYDILNSFVEIAEYKKDFESASYYNEKKIFIKENLEKHAWDGGWYRRAYFDDGTPLGSRENPECQIDSLAQSWAVISGASKSNEKDSSESKTYKYQYTNRAIEAMEAVERNLVKKDKGMILLLAPPFNNSYLEPGYIKGYVPGVRENGGQYTHAAVWVILALTKLGLGDKAAKYYNMINPINHSKTELECMLYKTEPYVMSADVYIKEPHGGRGGWSWYTGASGWMYRVGIENILGLRRVKDKGYEINPCVPKEWNEYEIKIKNETENYTIKVKRIKDYSDNDVASEISKGNSINDKVGCSVLKVVINGEISKTNIVPRHGGTMEIEVFFN